MYADISEELGGDEQIKQTALIRKEIEENQAIEDALKAALLQEMREEAARGVRVQRGGEVEEWDSGGGVGASRGKGRRKNKKSGKARWKSKKEREKQGKEEEEAAEEKREEEVEVEEKVVEKDDCAICTLSMEEEGVAVVVLVCIHRFHDSCLSLWVDKCRSKDYLPSCPLCRSEVQRATTAQT